MKFNKFSLLSLLIILLLVLQGCSSGTSAKSDSKNGAAIIPKEILKSLLDGVLEEVQIPLPVQSPKK